MKIAVLYPYSEGAGGGERCAYSLTKYLNAHLFTLFYSDFLKPIEKRIITPKVKIPAVDGLKQTASLFYFKQLDLSYYDKIIIGGGDWAITGARKGKTLWYCNSPLRIIYDLNQQNKMKRHPMIRPFYDAWLNWLKKIDQKYVKNVSKIISNSRNVANRVREYYNRESEVVHCPVDTKKFRHRESGDFFLSVQKLMWHKRVEIQVNAFKNLNQNLIIVGKGPEENRLRKLVGDAKNIRLFGEVFGGPLVNLYSRCKAVIQTSINEDFGIVPIEAMASGKPCIAVNEGGFKESIIHGKTGILLEKPYVASLRKVVPNFDKFHFDPKYCQKVAEKFDTSVFIRKINFALNQISND